MTEPRMLALIGCILLLLLGNLCQGWRLRRLERRHAQLEQWNEQHASVLTRRLHELEGFRERFDPRALEHQDEEFLAVLRSLATYIGSIRRGEPAAAAAGAPASGGS